MGREVEVDKAAADGAGVERSMLEVEKGEAT